MANSTSTDLCSKRTFLDAYTRWTLPVSLRLLIALLTVSSQAFGSPAPPISVTAVSPTAKSRGVASHVVRAHRPASASERLQATQVLRHALLSPTTTLFAGEQTVLNFDRGEGTACVTEETHLGPGRYRIDTKNPPEARGRIQMADKGWRRLYLPQAHLLVKRPLLANRLTRAGANRRIARIRQQYRLMLAPRLANVDGRRAYVLDITPRSADRPHQKLWIDRSTGLILRRETYSPTGVQTSVTYWRDLHFFRHPSYTALAWKPDAGVKVEEDKMEQETDRWEQARSLAGTWANVPTDLGRGFTFENAHIVHALGTRGLYCEYSDGLNSLSLVQFSGPHAVTEGASTGNPLRTRQVGDHKAQISVRGPVMVLTWQNGPQAGTLSLIGEMAESTLIAIARSLP